MLSRIVITGMGVVTAAGVGPASLCETLRAGRSHTHAIDSFDTRDLSSRIGAPAVEFEAREFLGGREIRRLDRSAQLLFAACTMAIADSAILNSQTDTARIGLFEGSALGGLERALQEQEVLERKGHRRVSPTTVTAAMHGIGGSMVALHHGLHGPVVNCANGSVSSACAVATACDQLRLQRIDAAVVGGGEAPVNRHVFVIFSRIGLLSTRNGVPEQACRPFDATRDGVVLGEGGAAFVLERLESAERRGATIYGEVLAVGMTNDADNLIAPAPNGIQLARAMQLAREQAGISHRQVDYISAHGTSTLLNDRIETLAIKRAFGEQAYRIPISATKSMLGHTLGACTVIDIAATLMAMQHHFIPPTINLCTPDPECDLDYVPNAARHASIEVAMVNNSSFGGRNSSILLKRI